MNFPEAPAIPRPDSARAPLFMTPSIEPRVPETDGENERSAPEPETPDAVLDANAEAVPCPMVWPGPFRVVPRKPVATWAND